MKPTGIVRKIDELGRIVLPMELRKTLDLKVKDSIGKEIKGMKINEEEKKNTTVEKKKSFCSMI